MVTNKKNIGVDRNNLIEVHSMKGLIGKLSFEDSLVKTTEYDDETQMPLDINYTKQYAFSMPSMKFSQENLCLTL